MKTEVREILHELDADFFRDTEVARAVNKGVVRFCAEERWPWLITEGTLQIAADDDEVEVPANVALNRFTNLSIDGDSMGITDELERLPADAGFRNRHRYETATGRPRYYYLSSATTDVDGDTQVQYVYKLVPASDADYDLTFQYTRQPVTLTADGDQPDLPLEYHDAVVAWAAGHLFLKEIRLSGKADEQFAVYMKILDQARKDVFTPATDEVIAWGRRHPGENYLYDADLRRRIPPTLG